MGIYPGGFEVTNRYRYVQSMKKRFLAQDIGCETTGHEVSPVRLFGGLKRDLNDLRRSITLTELFDVLHLAELQQYLFQLFEPDTAGHVADNYLVGAETKNGLLNGGSRCAANRGWTTCTSDALR